MKKKEKLRQEEANRLLYIFPLFLGIIGGLLMYLIVVKTDPTMAKKGIVFGVLMNIIGFVLIMGLL